MKTILKMKSILGILLCCMLFISACNKEEIYIPSEEILWMGKKPIDENLMKSVRFALNMDYIETPEYAGFSYNNIDQGLNIGTMFYKYFTLKMNELLGGKLTDQELETVRQDLVEASINVTDLDAYELRMFSKLLNIVNCKDYDERIKNTVEQYWNEEKAGYVLEGSSSNKDIYSMMVTTLYFIETLENISARCPHIEDIISSYDKNVAIIYENNQNVYAVPLIMLSDKIGHHSMYDHLFQQWLLDTMPIWEPSKNALNTIEEINDLYDCANVYEVDSSVLTKRFDGMVKYDYIMPGYNEYELLYILEYYELCNKIGRDYLLPKNTQDYIRTVIDTKFAIRGNTKIHSIYTYYGIVLSEAVDFSINKEKIKTYIYNKLHNEIEAKDVSVPDEYIIDVYFTLLCAKKLGIEVANDVKSRIAKDISSILEQMDYSDIESNIGKMHVIQFCCESLRIMEYKIVYKNDIKKYIKQVLNEEKCKNNISISDLALICDAIGMEKPQKLNEQIDEANKTLSLDGGFCFNEEIRNKQIVDIVSTIKMWRILDEKKRLYSDSLYRKYVIEDTIKDDQNNRLDLRSIYYFVIYCSRNNKEESRGNIQ